MKFKTDKFGERTLEHKDVGGDRLRIMAHLEANLYTILVNLEGVYASRKQLRKLAKAILKETEK
jgi:hypothetical protein